MFGFIGMSRDGEVEKQKFRAEVYSTFMWVLLWSLLLIVSYFLGRSRGEDTAQLAVAAALTQHSTNDGVRWTSLELRMGKLEDKVDRLLTLAKDPKK